MYVILMDYNESNRTLMVVEFDTGGHQRPSEYGLAGYGPDAFFGAFLNENETVAGDAE